MIDPLLESEILERIQRIPAFSAMKVKIDSFSQGECIAYIPKDDAFDGIYESFHGGMLMAAADTISCFALMTLTGTEAAMATTDMNIRFLAPCLTGVKVVAKVIKFGRTLSPVHVDLYDDNGKHVAVAQVCYIRFEAKPSRLN